MGLYSDAYPYHPKKPYPSEGRVKQALSFDLHGLVKRGIISRERARELRRPLQAPGPSNNTTKSIAIETIDRLITQHPHLGRAPRRPRGRYNYRDNPGRSYPWEDEVRRDLPRRSMW